VLLHFLIPAAVAGLTAKYMRLAGHISPGDMKI